jgi:hypothetical protein
MIVCRFHRCVVPQTLHPINIEQLESRRLLSAAVSATPLAAFLTPLPASALPGAKATARISVTNNGNNHDVGEAQISLLATTAGTIASAVGTVKMVTEHVDLAPGQFQRFAVGFIYPTDLPAGSYKFIASVTFDGAVSQSASTTGGVVIAPPFASLSAYFQQAPSQVMIGLTPAAPLSLVLSNAGNIPANGSLTISLFESPTQTLGSGSLLLDTFSSVPLSVAPNSTESVSLTEKKIPVTAATGEQYLIAVVNAKNTNPQIGTTNITATSTAPTNFTTLQFTALPSQATLGRAAPISLQIVNAETTRLQGDIDITFSQSATPNGASPSPLETFSDRSINIPPGGTETYTLNLKAPSTTALGYQFLIASLSPVTPLVSNRITDATIVSQGITAFVEPT